MQISMEKYGAFWFFMCCTVVGIVFVYILLPETKGKTLEDIEKLFSKKYNADGTLKAPEVQEDKYSDGKTASIASSGIEMTKTNSFRQKKSDENGTVAVENGNGFTNVALNPIVDSEDEEEEDGSLVAAPGGH
jgi:hypothetical protein